MSHDLNDDPRVLSPALLIRLGYEEVLAYMQRIGANAIVLDEEGERLVWERMEVGRG